VRKGFAGAMVDAEDFDHLVGVLDPVNDAVRIMENVAKFYLKFFRFGDHCKALGVSAKEKMISLKAIFGLHLVEHFFGGTTESLLGFP
jgi:hypothetical protein